MPQDKHLPTAEPSAEHRMWLLTEEASPVGMSRHPPQPSPHRTVHTALSKTHLGEVGDVGFLARAIVISSRPRPTLSGAAFARGDADPGQEVTRVPQLIRPDPPSTQVLLLQSKRAWLPWLHGRPCQPRSSGMAEISVPEPLAVGSVSRPRVGSGTATPTHQSLVVKRGLYRE